MTRTMYDGVTAASLPRGAAMVAGYVDGLYAWSAADWALFPNARKVRIAVFSETNDGEVLDVEPGNATPAQSVDWVLMRRRAGADPSVYMNTSTWPTVRAAFQARGVAEPHYWVAQYDGVASLAAGAIAKQYTDDVRLGHPWDLSVVADYWPGVDPAPTPTPPPHQEDDTVPLLLAVQADPANPNVNQGIWYQDGALLCHVVDPTQLPFFQSVPNVHEGQVSYKQFQAIKAAVAALGASVTVDPATLAAAITQAAPQLAAAVVADEPTSYLVEPTAGVHPISPTVPPQPTS